MLDQKALEAAFDEYRRVAAYGPCDPALEAAIEKYASIALPPVADDVAEMVKRLHEGAPLPLFKNGKLVEFDADAYVDLRQKAAALLEALSQSREADRVRAKNEGIEMAAAYCEGAFESRATGSAWATNIRALKEPE